MAFCAECGAQMADGATFCGQCGRPVVNAAAVVGPPVTAGPAAATGGGLASNVAGALAYVTIIPAILFLVLEPYNKDRFVRFHAFQSIFFCVGWIALWIAMIFVHIILRFIPMVGWVLSLVVSLVFGLGIFIVWILLVYKAFNNQKWMLPVIGNLAEQQASR